MIIIREKEDEMRDERKDTMRDTMRYEDERIFQQNQQ